MSLHWTCHLELSLAKLKKKVCKIKENGGGKNWNLNSSVLEFFGWKSKKGIFVGKDLKIGECGPKTEN